MTKTHLPIRLETVNPRGQRAYHRFATQEKAIAGAKHLAATFQQTAVSLRDDADGKVLFDQKSLAEKLLDKTEKTAAADTGKGKK